jgi:hypothetical protein
MSAGGKRSEVHAVGMEEGWRRERKKEAGVREEGDGGVARRTMRSLLFVRYRRYTER